MTKKLIDKIEHKGRQTYRWVRVISIIFLILFFTLLFLFVSVRNYKQSKMIGDYISNMEEFESLNKSCVENFGKTACKNEGKKLGAVNIDDFTFEGVFICFGKFNKKTEIGIPKEQIELCKTS